MAVKLLYRDAQGRDASVDVNAEGVYLGRGSDCAVRTDDAMVSRRNCRIYFGGGRWMVEDLNSSNGTFVNGAKIQKRVLAHADVVRCGSLQVRFVDIADAAQSIQISPELDGPEQQLQKKIEELAAMLAERDGLKDELRKAQAALERFTAREEAEQEELKRLRAEAIGLKDRAAAAIKDKTHADEELNAQVRVAEELRRELNGLKQEHVLVRTRADEASEELAARDRQLERALEDVQKTKQAMDELRQRLAELQKTKDEGWKELNNRMSELDHLREVINQQEQLLEERRIGLISLEASLQEIRVEKDKLLREFLTMRSERDEARDKVVRLSSQNEALEEEHRRLARAMASSGALGANPEEALRMSSELRDARVDLKKTEAERNRLQEQLARAEGDRNALEEKFAALEVERAHILQEQKANEIARMRAEESAAKAEVARQRSEEERVAASQARDAALTSADEQRRDAERERKRSMLLEDDVKNARAVKPAASTTLAGGSTLTGELNVNDLPTNARRGDADERIAQLEEELAKLGTELALAESRAHEAEEKLKKMPAAKPESAPLKSGSKTKELETLRVNAQSAYNGINDLLAELRTNILLVRDLVAEHKKSIPDGDVARTLEEAVDNSVARTEDAKGLLRPLRELVER